MILTHPVFIKRGATSPRNQKNVVTAADRTRFYQMRDRLNGESIVDVKNRLKWWKHKRAVCDPQFKGIA